MHLQKAETGLSKGTCLSDLSESSPATIPNREKNHVWCTDFSYLFLSNGTMRFNCTILDLYDRSVIASENEKCITNKLTVRTLEKTIQSSGCNPKNLTLHSDQGSQFTSLEFVSYCRDHGITQSMSRAGYPYDHAPMERYYNT